MSEQLEQFRMLIGGKAVDAISGRTFESENPYTGRPWAVIPDAGTEDVDAAVQAARSALDGEWGQLTGFARSRLMRLLGDLISVNAPRLAAELIAEAGFPPGVVNVITGAQRRHPRPLHPRLTKGHR